MPTVDPPQTVRLVQPRRILQITWAPGHVAEYPYTTLRALCPCANCRDERTGELILDVSKIPADLGIETAGFVGNYAIQFQFSDGHSTGVYPWDLLYDVCPCPQCRARREPQI